VQKIGARTTGKQLEDEALDQRTERDGRFRKIAERVRVGTVAHSNISVDAVGNDGVLLVLPTLLRHGGGGVGRHAIARLSGRVLIKRTHDGCPVNGLLEERTYPTKLSFPSGGDAHAGGAECVRTPLPPPGG